MGATILRFPLWKRDRDDGMMGRDKYNFRSTLMCKMTLAPVTSNFNFYAEISFGNHIFICVFGTHSIHVYLIHSNTILFSMFLLLLLLLSLLLIFLFSRYISADSFGIYLWRNRGTEISPFIGISNRKKITTTTTTTIQNRI